MSKADGFKVEVLHPGPRICIFALLLEGAGHVQFMYAAATFFDMGGPQNLNLRVIGFVGDCKSYCQPTLYILPKENAWKWEKIVSFFEEDSSLAHYTKEESWGKL